MSRKYMNERWCVRCSKNCASPYVRDNLYHLGIDVEDLESDIETFDPRNVLDIGCGNGRNTKYMKQLGFKKIMSLDMASDFGIKCILGVNPLPVRDGTIDIILCNYLLMFLSKKERKFLLDEIKRVAGKGCIIVVELYPAKDSYTPTKEKMIELNDEIFNYLGWEKIRYARKGGKFIAKKNT